MKKILTLSLFFTVMLSACSSVLEPTVEGIEHVDVVNISKDNIELNAFMVLKNPNGFELDLDNADLTLYVDEVEIAKVNQTFETTMPKDGNFNMPININMDLKKLYDENPLKALSKGLEIMSDKKLDVHFKGTIDVGKGMAKISVPIDQLEEVKF